VVSLVDPDDPASAEEAFDFFLLFVVVVAESVVSAD